MSVPGLFVVRSTLRSSYVFAVAAIPDDTMNKFSYYVFSVQFCAIAPQDSTAISDYNIMESMTRLK